MYRNYPNQHTNSVIGITGSTGPTGPTGVPGEATNTGATGPAGITGEMGPQGDAGPSGSIGNTGQIGPTGDAGDTGPIGPQGARGSTGYYASFYDTQIQSNINLGNPNQVLLNNQTLSFGIVIDDNGMGDPTRIKTNYNGIYHITFSLQYENNGLNKTKVYTWLSKNEIDINWTISEITIETLTCQNLTWYVLSLNAGDYIEIKWKSSDSNVFLTSTLNNPSVIVNVNQVSYNGPTGPSGITGPSGYTGSTGPILT
jgi:hypothetical protein